MEQNKKVMFFTAAVRVALVLAACLLYHYVVLPPTSGEIFEKVVESVVEVKAQIDEGTVSFGSAEVASKDGKLITNAHVITYSKLGQIVEFDKYYIRFAFEDDFREAVLIKYNIEIDLAVLQIKELPSFKLKPIKKTNIGSIKAGAKVYAVGNSQNHGIGISQGIISIPLLKIEYQEKTIDAIKCDLIITEGNSGGALVDERGNLIGITTFRLKDNFGNVVYGVAYCIPINIIFNYLND